jgi:peptidoglycan biosynthesis protein MviN/MurJ (putative lipid II flippase)
MMSEAKRRSPSGRALNRLARSRIGIMAWRTASRRALWGTIIGSAPGFALPFVVTSGFTAGRITDAYFFAFSIAMFVTACYEGILQANATPVLQSDKSAGRTHFLGAVRRVLWQSSAATAITYLIVAGILAAVAVSGRSNWTPSERHTCLILMAYFTIYVVASTVTAVLASGLYALEDFFVPIATMALRSLVPLTGLALLNRGISGIEVFGLLMGVGELLRAGVLGRRLLIKSRPLEPGPIRHRLGLWRTAIPHGAAMVAAAANPVIDRLVAAPLGPGSVTILELGEKVFYVPMMGLTALFIVVAGVRWTGHTFSGGTGLRADFRRTVARAVALAGGAATLFISGAVLIRLVAGKEIAGAPTGAFTAVTIYLLIGLPAALVIGLGARFLAATRKTHLLPIFAGLGIVVNVGGDLVGERLLGIEGIALASTLMRLANALLYLYVCSRILRAGRFSSASVVESQGVAEIGALAAISAGNDPVAEID